MCSRPVFAPRSRPVPATGLEDHPEARAHAPRCERGEMSEATSHHSQPRSSAQGTGGFQESDTAACLVDKDGPLIIAVYAGSVDQLLIEARLIFWPVGVALFCSLDPCPCTLSPCNCCKCCAKCGAIIEEQLQMGAGPLHSALSGLDEPSPAGSPIVRYLLRTPWNSDDERLVVCTLRRGHLSPLPAWFPQAGARTWVTGRVAVPCVGMGVAMWPPLIPWRCCFSPAGSG